jgi:hypothetical protein
LGGSGRFSAGHEGSQVCWRSIARRPGTNPQIEVLALMQRTGSSETGENGEAGRRKDPETVRAKPVEQAKQQTEVNGSKWKASSRNRAQIVGFRACAEQSDGGRASCAHTGHLLKLARASVVDYEMTKLPFTLKPEMWFAMEYIFPNAQRHYSPVWIERVTALKSGHGVLEVAFFTQIIPKGSKARYTRSAFSSGRRGISSVPAKNLTAQLAGR